MKQLWLKDWPWETVVTINAALCQEKKALHKPTSDGYEPARKLWEKSRDRHWNCGRFFRSAADVTGLRHSVFTMETHLWLLAAH
jgi:hypothetical protein